MVYGPGGQYMTERLTKWDLANDYRGVFTDPTYGPVLSYHYVNTTIEYADAQKRFGLNHIYFPSGWPVVRKKVWLVLRFNVGNIATTESYRLGIEE